jgi:ribosome-associated protein
MVDRISPPSGVAIVVTDVVYVPESAVTMTAVRSSGPGGQNVNKVASKVDMRVDLEAIVGLDEPARQRLIHKVSSRLDADGKLWVTSQKTRDQLKNIADAEEKIRILIAAALVVPKPRKSTRPSKRSVEKRLGEKKLVGARKKERARRVDKEPI